MVRVLGSVLQSDFQRTARSFAFALSVVLLPAPAGAGGDVERGRALFALAAGCGCHTAKDGPVGAGGGEVPTPFGTYYGTNLTPDPETGIGKWTDAQIVAAIREGTRPDGSVESPAMPYYHYAGMADADVADLIAFLRSLPPVRRPNRPHVGEPPLARWGYRAWRRLFVPSTVPPAVAPTNGAARGRYLADHVAICTDCHTPRNRLGAFDRSMYLAGTAHGPGGKSVPNITPGVGGIAGWDVDEIVDVLADGTLPNYDNVQGYMAEVVEGVGGGPGYKDAEPADLRSVATYVKTVPPIDNRVRGE